MSYLQKDEMVETEHFIRTFDKFFDCLNVRSISRKLKQNLQPYRNSCDERLKVGYHNTSLVINIYFVTVA